MADQYEQILPCVMCGQHNEQMLMLACMDDPCINCAAKYFCSTKSLNSNIYLCVKCGESTELDPTSVAELENVYNQFKSTKKYAYQRAQGSITDTEKPVSSHRNLRKQMANQREITDIKDRNYEHVTYQNTQSNYQPTYTPISQPSYLTNSYNNIPLRKIQQITYMCQTHSQQQLSYYCFECNIPICPQCVIHGTHRQHQVETTRKAINIIKTNLHKCLDSVNQQISSIVNIVDHYKNNIKENQILIKKQKDIVKDNFNVLKNILNQKEKQFIKNIQFYFQSNNNTMKNQTSTYDRIIGENSNAKKSIQNTMKKDGLAMLQEYSQREKQANSAIQNSKNKKYNPNLEGLKEIDYELFKDEVGQYSGIMSAFRLAVQPKKRTS